MHSLIVNHPFLDGNKRSGAIAMGVFLGLNGWLLRMDEADLIDLALDIARDGLDVEAISKQLAEHSVELDLSDEM